MMREREASRQSHVRQTVRRFRHTTANPKRVNHVLPWPNGTFALLLVLTLLLLGRGSASAQNQKPLSEDEVSKLTDQFKDKVVIDRLEKNGIAFNVDDEVIARLKKAGASDDVLAAVRKLGGGGGGASGGKAVTYQEVTQLLRDGMKEKKIMELLAKSPTRFTLGAGQVAELKKLEASDELIRFMQDRNVGTPVHKLTDLVIILDCSGSMEERTTDGITKMAAAKKVLAEILPKIPDGLRTCFMIYGHDKALECQAVKIVRPLASLDNAGREELKGVIDGLQPTGHTPIALSLRTAGRELAKRSDALCGIILITDGMETCRGNPAAEAAILTRTLKLEFGVNVVGLALNEQETKAVKEIAEKGNGVFVGANNVDELSKGLGKLVQPIVPPPAPPVNPGSRTGRRAINVPQPRIQWPALARFALKEAGAAAPDANVPTPSAAEVTNYGEIRLPSDKKYDLWFVPKQGRAILMLKSYSIAERVVKDEKVEDHLGLIQVSSDKKPERIGVVTTGSGGPDTAMYYFPVQEGKLGDLMVVPAGEYDVYLIMGKGQKAVLAEEKLRVKAGEVTKVE